MTLGFSSSRPLPSFLINMVGEWWYIHFVYYDTSTQGNRFEKEQWLCEETLFDFVPSSWKISFSFLYRGKEMNLGIKQTRSHISSLRTEISILKWCIGCLTHSIHTLHLSFLPTCLLASFCQPWGVGRWKPTNCYISNKRFLRQGNPAPLQCAGQVPMMSFRALQSAS